MKKLLIKLCFHQQQSPTHLLHAFVTMAVFEKWCYKLLGALILLRKNILFCL